MKKIIIFFVSLILLGCGNNIHEDKSNQESGNSMGMTRDEYLHSLDSAEMMNGLVFWTSDTAFTTNAALLLLLDTLYQHVKADGFPSEVKKEENWMSDYRSRLVAYYDVHLMENDTISPFAKADSVLKEGARLLELDCHWSTMEMVVYNSTIFTLNRCREYCMLTRLINSCESDEAKELVYKEWSLYEQMFKKIGPIASNMVSLNYWGGSITGPLSTASYLQISESRRDMYQTILDIVKGDGWDNTGVFPENAERFFFDCCATALNRTIKETDDFYKEYEGKERSESFDDAIMKTGIEIDELRPIMKEWIVTLDKLDDELTHDSSRHAVERAASHMIMKWASIVTER